jgi:asparagine synthetase B (glutamine-hydrolysing)
MCGIYGYLSSTQNNITDVTKAGYSSKNRGPERTITHHTEDMFLMFHRLAIMNISPLLDQPHVYKSTDDSYYYIMCNGEIYNYESICKRFLEINTPNDTSCIYPLFEAFDYDFIKLNNELNGEYSLGCK